MRRGARGLQRLGRGGACVLMAARGAGGVADKPPPVHASSACIRCVHAPEHAGYQCVRYTQTPSSGLSFPPTGVYKHHQLSLLSPCSLCCVNLDPAARHSCCHSKPSSAPHRGGCASTHRTSYGMHGAHASRTYLWPPFPPPPLPPRRPAAPSCPRCRRARGCWRRQQSLRLRRSQMERCRGSPCCLLLTCGRRAAGARCEV